MQTSKQKVKRDDFVSAITMADACITNHFPNTKLAWYCEKFIEFNKTPLKQHNKELTKLTKALTTEMQSFRIDHAVEKDGKLLFEDKRYCYNKEGEKAVLAKEAEVNEKITEVVEALMTEQIEVTCITNKFEKLPAELTPLQFKALNNFVFKNINEHAEEISHEEAKSE